MNPPFILQIDYIYTLWYNRIHQGVPNSSYATLEKSEPTFVCWNKNTLLLRFLPLCPLWVVFENLLDKPENTVLGTKNCGQYTSDTLVGHQYTSYTLQITRSDGLSVTVFILHLECIFPTNVFILGLGDLWILTVTPWFKLKSVKQTI